MPKVDPVPEPQAPTTVVNKPPAPACTQFPEVSVDTERLPLKVEEAETRTPFADPFIRLGKMNVSVRFVMLHGAEVVANAVAGRTSNDARSIFKKVLI